jgi:hypothetical protein
MREGNAFPNELRLESNSALLRFPWSELPRWMDLSSEVFAWEQWQWSNDKLKSSLAKGARSEQRRSAFVTLAREGSLSDPRVRAWSETFTDKVGVQLRIQAFVAAKDWNKAALFLDQYASLFGRDSFLNHWMGQLSWARGDFLAAYAHWNSQNSSNFADLYWTAGWDAMFQTLTRDRPLDKSVFATLREASKSDVWAKSYLTKLCVENQIDCGTSTVADWVSNIKIVKGTPWTFESADRKGFWTMSRDALKSVVERQVDTVTQIEGLEPLRQALSQVWELRETAYGRDSDRETLALYNQLKKRVDAKQDTLDQIQKTKSLTVGAAH